MRLDVGWLNRKGPPGNLCCSPLPGVSCTKTEEIILQVGKTTDEGSGVGRIKTPNSIGWLFSSSSIETVKSNTFKAGTMSL